MKLLLATTLFTLLQAKTYFKETFDTGNLNVYKLMK